MTDEFEESQDYIRHIVKELRGFAEDADTAFALDKAFAFHPCKGLGKIFSDAAAFIEGSNKMLVDIRSATLAMVSDESGVRH